MFTSCFEKQRQVKATFVDCLSQEAKYQKIIELGRQQGHFNPLYEIEANLVKGCQSRTYLHSFVKEGMLFFEAKSEALISAGLAQILIMVFSGENPETILKCPPLYLDELGLSANLTPSRANGLHSIHLRMKQEALKRLLNAKSSENAE